MLVAPKTWSNNIRYAQPFCKCWSRKNLLWSKENKCACGEENEVTEWGWELPASGSSWLVVNENRKQVTFHPVYSTGTAAARGEMPMVHNYHYYWEVKILTDTYGTDVMVGLGTLKVDITESQFKFTSLLGQDEQSYGLSYTGSVRHDTVLSKEGMGFCRGSIVGVRVDMWHGTLEFYINRKPQGISFFNLRRHKELYPMVCSTAAQSSMRLIYAASWRASLLVDAAKVLAASLRQEQRDEFPPGLLFAVKKQFWLTMPSAGDRAENEIDLGAPKMTKSMLNADPDPEYESDPDPIPHYIINTNTRDYQIVRRLSIDYRF